MGNGQDRPPASVGGTSPERTDWNQKVVIPVVVSVLGAIAVTALTPLGENLRELLFPTKAAVFGSVLLDGEGKADAKLMLDGRNMEPTDANGGFELPDVGDGNHVLDVTAPGAEAKLSFNVARGSTSEKVGAIELTRIAQLGYHLKTVSPTFGGGPDQANVMYEFTLWIDGEPDVTRRIRSVSYTLPGPVNEPVTRTERARAFCYHVLGDLSFDDFLGTVGAFASATAVVRLADGQTFDLSAAPSEPSGTLSCPLTRKLHRTTGGGNESEGSQAGRNQSGGNRTGGNQTGGNQTGGSQTGGNEGSEFAIVPSVLGQTYEAASANLEARGFKVDRNDVESSQKAGTVVDQAPSGGTSHREGTTVTLDVSKGPAATTVPDVTGVDRETASSQLEDAGFKVNVDEEDVEDATLDGIVLRQNPSGGTQAASGKTVTIVVGRFATASTDAVPR